MREVIDLSIQQDSQFSKELSLLIDVVSNTHIAKKEEIIWEIRHNEKDFGLFLSLLKVFKDASFCHISSDLLDNISGFSTFALSSEIVNPHISNAIANVFHGSLLPQTLKVPLSYLLDELVCNMQQHSGCKYGNLYLNINKTLNTIDVLVADNGITIYGSFISSGKYLEYIGTSCAEALSLAKDGYSTKNRPNAENRGYGISSNTRMVVDGLNGVFSIISGSAVFLNTPTLGQQVIETVDYFEWPGTAIIVRIPLNIPSSFAFYDYIS